MVVSLVVSQVCRMRIWLFAYAICDFLKKSDGRVMPVSIIRIYLLNDLYARALSTRLIPSAPNLMSPCAERGCSTFRFDIATKYHSRLYSYCILSNRDYLLQ